MRSVSANLKAHFGQEVTTLALCWRIKRTDDVEFGFTSHTKNLTIGGLVYEASTGFTASQIELNSKLSVDNQDTMGLIDSDTIKELDLAAGIYDYAEVEIFIVNYKSLGDGTLTLKFGKLGEVTRRDDHFFAEIRGLTQHLQQVVGDLYSVTCRADLGDSECKVTLASFTVTGTLTGVTSNRVFADSSRSESNDYFNFGLLTWTSGNNNGLSMEVQDFVQSTGQFTLFQPMPFTVQVGDQYSVYAGCDKLLSTCKNKFNNVVNFRGEPYIPGPDTIIQGPK